jgi:hypothetical protein
MSAKKRKPTPGSLRPGNLQSRGEPPCADRQVVARSGKVQPLCRASSFRMRFTVAAGSSTGKSTSQLSTARSTVPQRDFVGPT